MSSPQTTQTLEVPKPIASRATPIPQIGRSPEAPPFKSAVLQLLQLESDMRKAASLQELLVLVVNGSRQLMNARQIFAVATERSTGLAIVAASELAAVDRGTPLAGWIERVLTRLESDAGLQARREFTLRAYSVETDQAARLYPLDQALWVPLAARDGTIDYGLLCLRETPWRESDVTIAQRVGETAAHAVDALRIGRVSWDFLRVNHQRMKRIAAAAFLVAMFPVSMTTLAPLEIGPRDAFIVAAPIDGVVEEILVPPSSEVVQGQVLLRFADTISRNKFIIAEREVAVADARLKKSMQQSFSDVRGRHEVGIAQAELQLKRAERDLAREVLGRSVVKAARAGTVVFGDPRDLLGKPLQTGEKIMEIADPTKVEIRIDVSVNEPTTLWGGARVKAFLDSSPLRPREAQLVRADYQARLREGNALSFRAVAQIENDGKPPPRLGVRGTAQIYGNTVPLFYYLLRRPIAAVRQWTGF